MVKIKQEMSTIKLRDGTLVQVSTNSCSINQKTLVAVGHGEKMSDKWKTVLVYRPARIWGGISRGVASEMVPGFAAAIT